MGGDFSRLEALADKKKGRVFTRPFEFGSGSRLPAGVERLVLGFELLRGERGSSRRGAAGFSPGRAGNGGLCRETPRGDAESVDIGAGKETSDVHFIHQRVRVEGKMVLPTGQIKR